MMIAGAVLALGACTSMPTPTGPGTPPAPTANALSTATPTTTRSAAPTAAVAPTPTQLSTPSYFPPPPVGSLRVDGLASVVVDRLLQVVDPANPTAHPRQNRGLNVLVSGGVVLLTDGPRSVRGRDYWQVFDDSLGRTVDLNDPGRPLGWVPAQRGGAATLTPLQLECPQTLPTTAAELERLQRLSEFSGLACFGSRVIVLTGHVRCFEGHGDGVLGAPFFDGRRTCTLDGVSVNGQPVFDLLPDVSGGRSEIEGTYEVHGQFDHLDSGRCTWIPFGTSPGPSGPPDPGAVASCRQFFVVTAVEEL